MKALSVISRLAVMPCATNQPERALDEGGDGRGLLVGVQLDVGQAGVVVDDRVSEVVADAGLGRIQLRLRCERSPVTAWPGRSKRA